MTKDEMKNRISMALKDSILQQGFECICKENAELKSNNNIYCEGEGETLVVNVSFDKFTRINANHKMFYPRNEELEKENAELKNQVSFLKDNLRVARKDRENLQLDVAKGLKEFVKDYPATAFRYLANEKYIEQFIKAKELLTKWVELYKPKLEGYPIPPIQEQTEQFLKEVEK